MDRKSRASRAASLDETNEEVSLWKQICSSLLKLENVQKESEPIITSVNKLHMTIESIDGKLIDLGQRRKNIILIIEILAISPSTSYKLKELYSEGITTSISESK
jgi:hypothetical protein